MNKEIADLILLWHGVHVSLGNCIESARVVLDQQQRGTLLPDRVREMRGELLATQEKIPQLADLLEELVGETVWPMKPEAESPVSEPIMGEPDAEAAAEEAPDIGEPPEVTAEGDYDATGATPPEKIVAEEEAATAEMVIDEETAAEAGTTETP